MYINTEELLKFLEQRFTWPLHVDPGRASGKTTAAIEIALRYSCGIGMPSLMVMPNRRAFREAERKWEYAIKAGTLSLTTYDGLETFVMGRRFACILFDEPSLHFKYGASAYCRTYMNLCMCPGIIFGN